MGVLLFLAGIPVYWAGMWCKSRAGVNAVMSEKTSAFVKSGIFPLLFCFGSNNDYELGLSFSMRCGEVFRKKYNIPEDFQKQNKSVPQHHGISQCVQLCKMSSVHACHSRNCVVYFQMNSPVQCRGCSWSCQEVKTKAAEMNTLCKATPEEADCLCPRDAVFMNIYFQRDTCRDVQVLSKAKNKAKATTTLPSFQRNSFCLVVSREPALL